MKTFREFLEVGLNEAKLDSENFTRIMDKIAVLLDRKNWRVIGTINDNRVNESFQAAEKSVERFMDFMENDDGDEG